MLHQHQLASRRRPQLAPSPQGSPRAGSLAAEFRAAGQQRRDLPPPTPATQAMPLPKAQPLVPDQGMLEAVLMALLQEKLGGGVETGQDAGTLPTLPSRDISGMGIPGQPPAITLGGAGAAAQRRRFGPLAR